MNSLLRNILAIVGGIIIGSIVNMGLITISGSIIPVPEGVDPTDMESIKENIHLYEFKHFVFPFLAHALGTLVGAWVACKYWIGENKIRPAMVVSLVFLLGGILMAYQLPAPLWVEVTDLLFAYIPMGYLGLKLAR